MLFQVMVDREELICRFPYALPCVCISAFAVAGFIATFVLPVILPSENIRRRMRKGLKMNTGMVHMVAQYS